MKKFLLFVAAFALSVSVATAQIGIIKNDKIKRVVEKNQTSIKIDNEKKKIHKMPARVQLAENQSLIGAYTSDEYASAEHGIGLPQYPGNIEIMSFIESSYLQEYQGYKIVGMRFALALQTPVSNVFIYLEKNGGLYLLASANVTADVVAGWNTVMFDVPVTLDLTGMEHICLGFTYNQSNSNDGQYYNAECFPLSFVKSDYVAPTLAFLQDGYYPINTEEAGTLSVQAIVVENKILPKDIVLKEMAIEKSFYKGGETMQYAVALYNFGTEPIANVELATYIDGVETEQPLTVTNVTTEMKTVEGKLTVPSNIISGKHEFKVTVKSIDGVVPTENVDDDKLAIGFSTYVSEVARQKNLIEQFTSQGCPNCPNGTTALENFVATRNDIAWVAVHGNMQNYNDQFYLEENDYLMAFQNIRTFPTASFNRTVVNGEIGVGIGFNSSVTTQQINDYFGEIVNYSNVLTPTLATVNISGSYDEATRKLDVKVSGSGADAEKVLEGFGVNVFLTENGIIADQGFSDGTLHKGYTHNNVFRGALTNILGETIQWNGDNYENTYSTTLPEGWNADNMEIVAFIAPIIADGFDFNNECVTNANSVTLKNIASGIKGVYNNGADAVETARYNAAGQVISAPQKGLNIVKMSNGETRKIIVK